MLDEGKIEVFASYSLMIFLLPINLKKMKPKEFVENFKLEKDSLLREFINNESQSEVQKLIQSMKLNNEQSEIMKQIINSTLRIEAYAYEYFHEME